MKHLGDITKLKGNELPIVDIITGGSPCQDLSVAGKRAGLGGERSGLFMEQIRIVKEMRDESVKKLQMSGATFDIRHIRPRYMVWENVPGAFSSNKGEDFRCVLEEICRIKDKAANVPMPEKGKWSTSGCIMGDGWSVAWRVHDAQFWGVPQRRKRISLVADFGGESAPEILFEREGLSRDFEESGEKGQGVATNIERSIDKAISFQERAGKPGGGKGILIQNERTGALSTLNNQSVCYGLFSQNNNSMKSSNPHSGIYEADTARTLVLENHPADSRVKICEDNVFQTLSSRMGTGGGNVPMVMEEPYNATTGSFMRAGNSGVAETLAARDYKDPQIVAYGLDQGSYHAGYNANFGFSVGEDKIGTQTASGPGAVRNQSVVRRLTPLECERLQGFPDQWTDIGEWADSKGKKHKDADSPRYKALGNSIALPFWQWMAERMINELNVEHPTMGSLFDGIGGFPLVYSRCGCEPIWASEIEEFPIAVTKIRFPEAE